MCGVGIKVLVCERDRQTEWGREGGGAKRKREREEEGEGCGGGGEGEREDRLAEMDLSWRFLRSLRSSCISFR